MDNIDYRNKDKELQIYHGSLDNYEESGNTQNDYNNTSDLNNNYETTPDELGNISEESYTNQYYSQRTPRNHLRANQNAMPLFLIGSFIFFLILLSLGIISFPSISFSKAPQQTTKKEHPFMSLNEISLPMLKGKFESELQTADLPAVNHAISMGKVRLERLFSYSNGWEDKTNESIEKKNKKEYVTYHQGLSFNQYQIDLLEKQLEMLEKKRKN